MAMNFLVSISLFFCMIILYARYVEPRRLVVRKIRIKSKHNIHSDLPLRITLLSDFHYPRYVNYRLVRQAIEKSNQFDPHLVFMLGDFFDKNKEDPAVLPNNVSALFSGIRSKLGVFGVLGNHDHWFDESAIRKVLESDTDIHLIDNVSVLIPLSGTRLYITGVGDLWSENARYDQAVANVPKDSLILLLSHNPDVVEDIRDPRILVQFSGHTHGGQVRLPFIGALRVPSKFKNKYAKGMIESANHLLYVNSGICSMKHIRFLCPPEVTWVEIY